MGLYLDDYDRDGIEDNSLENVDLYADESEFFDFESYEDKERYEVDESAPFDDVGETRLDDERSEDESDEGRATRAVDGLPTEEELADDPIRVYLTQMGNISMLSCEQERFIANEIEVARRRFRFAALSFDSVLREIVVILEKIESGRARLDRTVEVSVSAVELKKRIAAILPLAITTLRGILRKNRDDFLEISSRKLDAVRKKKLRRDIALRKRRAARLLVELRLRAQVYQSVLDQKLARYAALFEKLQRARELRKRLQDAGELYPSYNAARAALGGGRFFWKARYEVKPSTEVAYRELSLGSSSINYAEANRVPDASRWARLRAEFFSMRRELRRERRFSNESLASLARRIKRTEELREQFKTAKRVFSLGNLRLVVSIAKKYRNRGIEFPDLIQEGNTGLMHAVDKFEYRLGYKFSTYATWWIRQAISKAISDQRRTIRVPNRVLDAVKTISQSTREHACNGIVPPTIFEISGFTGLSPADIKLAQQATRPLLSLDRPIDGYDDAFFGDFLEDDKGGDPLDQMHRNALRERLEEALSALTFREREIIRLRYGLADGYGYTLEDVGAIFVVTRERVRQLEARAVRKLQNPTRRRQLECFLEESGDEKKDRGRRRRCDRKRGAGKRDDKASDVSSGEETPETSATATKGFVRVGVETSAGVQAFARSKSAVSVNARV